MELNKINAFTNSMFEFNSNRMLYFAVSGSIPRPESSSTDQSEKLEWKEKNAEAEFSPDRDTVFQRLAVDAYKNEFKNANSKEELAEIQNKIKKYEESIKNSLENHLAPGKTMDQLWSYLESQNCDLVTIIEGFLNFFEGKENKINIDQFFNEITFPAELTEDKAYTQNVEKEIQETKMALSSFLKDLRRANPNLPPPPTSLA